jgi:hypothetical protein
LIGRLPVVATLQELDEAALIQILIEPKNALVKQYQKLFSMEGVELEIRPNALHAVARKAIKRKTGRARPALHPRGGTARHHVRPARRSITSPRSSWTNRPSRRAASPC